MARQCRHCDVILRVGAEACKKHIWYSHLSSLLESLYFAKMDDPSQYESHQLHTLLQIFELLYLYFDDYIITDQIKYFIDRVICFYNKTDNKEYKQLLRQHMTKHYKKMFNIFANKNKNIHNFYIFETTKKIKDILGKDNLNEIYIEFNIFKKANKKECCVCWKDCSTTVAKCECNYNYCCDCLVKSKYKKCPMCRKII